MDHLSPPPPASPDSRPSATAAPFPPTATRDLVERVQAGDQEACRLLFEASAGRLAAWVHLRSGPRLRARMETGDVLQEIYLRAFRDLSTFRYRFPGSFHRWLIRIAAHTLQDLARREGREKRAAPEVALDSPSRPSGAGLAESQTPSRWLNQREGAENVIRLVSQLPARQQQVFRLACLEGLTTREIGIKLGQDPRLVSLWLHRALSRLRTLAVPGTHPGAAGQTPDEAGEKP